MAHLCRLIATWYRSMSHASYRVRPAYHRFNGLMPLDSVACYRYTAYYRSVPVWPAAVFRVVQQGAHQDANEQDAVGNELREGGSSVMTQIARDNTKAASY